MADASIHFYCTLYMYAKDDVQKVVFIHSYCSHRCMVLCTMSEEKLNQSFDEKYLIFFCKMLCVCALHFSDSSMEDTIFTALFLGLVCRAGQDQSMALQERPISLPSC